MIVYKKYTISPNIMIKQRMEKGGQMIFLFFVYSAMAFSYAGGSVGSSLGGTIGTFGNTMSSDSSTFASSSGTFGIGRYSGGGAEGAMTTLGG